MKVTEPKKGLLRRIFAGLGLLSTTASFAHASNLPPEDWATHVREENGSVWIITVDTAIANIAPGSGMDCVALEYNFSPGQLGPNGMPATEFAPLYYGLEDSISAKLSSQETRMVASKTGFGVRKVWFCPYGLELEAVIKLLVRDLSEISVNVTVGDISGVQALLPTKIESQISGNAKILASLQENGDDGTAKRLVMHWIFASATTDQSGIKAKLASLGYRVEEADFDKIRFSRLSDVMQSTVDQETRNLNALCTEYSCEYDGWETAVVRRGE